MRTIIFLATTAIAAGVMFISGCASNNMPTQTEYSGFLGDYSNLQQTQDPNGETLNRPGFPGGCFA